MRARGLVATAVASKVGILDVVAHADDELLAHRLDVHERAAVGQPELAAAVVVEAEAEIEKAVRRADVELHALEDGRDVVAAEAERALHALRVDRARTHPLGDGDLAHRRGAVAGEHLWDAGAILQMRGELILARQHRQRGARETLEPEARVEGRSVVVHRLLLLQPVLSSRETVQGSNDRVRGFKGPRVQGLSEIRFWKAWTLETLNP